MKMRWEEPRIEVQQFMPNEYVAVCWGVACSTGAANEVEQGWIIGGPWWDPTNNYEAGQTHSASLCGQTSHQWLVDSDNNNVAESEHLSRRQIQLWIHYYRAFMIKQWIDKERELENLDEMFI